MELRRDLISLLNSNGPPSALDTAIIQQEIIQLEAYLQKLRTITSPTRRIPAEVLGIIFAHTLEDEDDYKKRDSQLWRLCWVCKMWRVTAFSCAELWTRAEIDLVSLKTEDNAGGLSPDMVRWIGDRLKRGKGYPKTLRLIAERKDKGCSNCHYLQPKPDSPCSLDNPVLASLFCGAPAIDTLEIQCTSATCFKTLVNAVLASTPPSTLSPWASVRKLVLAPGYGRAGGWGEPNSWKDSLFIPFSSLRILDLALPYEEACDPDFETDEEGTRVYLSIPPPILNGLTELSLTSDWRGSQVANALYSCVALEVLNLDLDGCDQSWATTNSWRSEILGMSSNDFVVLPKVHTLRLSNIPPTQAATALRYLRTPGLRNLEFNFSDNHPYRVPDMETVWAFLRSLEFVGISESPPMIQSLSFTKPRLVYCETPIKMTQNDLKQLSLAFPNLTHLALLNSRFEGRPLSLLAPSIRTPSADPLFPHLESLSLSLEENRGSEPLILPTLLYTLIYRRRWSPDRLKEVNLSWREYAESLEKAYQTLDGVETLREMGVDLTRRFEPNRWAT